MAHLLAKELKKRQLCGCEEEARVSVVNVYRQNLLLHVPGQLNVLVSDLAHGGIDIELHLQHIWVAKRVYDLPLDPAVS